MSALENTVENILTSIFTIPVNSTIADFNNHSSEEWDSMKQLTLVTAIENEFDLFIEASDASKLLSFKAIVEFLQKHPDVV